ncbi:MAG: hypothetical protein AB1798_19005 [Spirochaetota bacterium]
MKMNRFEGVKGLRPAEVRLHTGFTVFTLLIVLGCVAVPFVYAQSPLDQITNVPGAYVYYIDRRGDADRLIGLLQFPDNHVLARVVDRNGTEVVFNTLIDRENYRNPERVQFERGSSDPEAREAAVQAVDSIFAFSQLRRLKPSVQFPDEIRLTKRSLDGKVLTEGVLKYWVPVTQVFELNDPSPGGKGLKLQHFGRVSSDEVPWFLMVTTPPQPKVEKYDQPAVGSDNPVIRFLYNVEFRLDDHWKPVTGLTAKDGYRYEGASKRDGYLTVEPLSLGQSELSSPYVYFANHLLTASYFIEPTSVITDTINSAPSISYVCVDPRSGSLNRVIQILIHQGGSEYKRIDYSSYESFFERNTDYIRRILTTFRDHGLR